MKYNRILLKLSGEALQGERDSGISTTVLKDYVEQIIEISESGCEIGIVIGGGNIFRGLSGTDLGYDRVKGDQMGMLATIINSIALESEFQKQGKKAKVFTSICMEPVGELYRRDEVVKEMKDGGIAILGGGTGNPYFTTDTAAALRAVEIGAEALLKGTRVDGVYDSDPETNPEAKKYDNISFDEAINKGLKIMDQTAFTMCRENSVNILVFDMNKKGNLKKVIEGMPCGTLVKN